jgi:hypothetical protein
MKRKKSKLKASYHWHRKAGLWLSTPVILVVITGIILNHGSGLNLDSNLVSNPAILSWYGMEPKVAPKALRNNELWATSLDGSLYVNGVNIAKDVETITGLGTLDSFFVVSSSSHLYLLDKDSLQLVEKLGSESLPPGRIIASAVQEQSLLLDTSQGSFRAEADIVSFSADARQSISALAFSDLSEEEYKNVLEDWRGRGLSLSRVLRDIHTGHFFGSLGVFVVDLAGLALMFLVGTGLYNMWKTK